MGSEHVDTLVNLISAGTPAIVDSAKAEMHFDIKTHSDAMSYFPLQDKAKSNYLDTCKQIKAAIQALTRMLKINEGHPVLQKINESLTKIDDDIIEIQNSIGRS